MESAQDDMEGDPGNGQPARPVGGAENIYAGDERQQTDQRSPHAIVVKWILRLKLTKVIDKPERAGGQVDTGDR